MPRASEWWDRWFLGLARYVASASKDPSTKVGAVIVRPDKTVASVGYNGFPRGVDDAPSRLNDRPTKYRCTVHAELNAILAANEPVRGFRIYVSPLHPCANCAAAIIQAGISEVIAEMHDAHPERWAESFADAGTMLREAGVRATILSPEAAS